MKKIAVIFSVFIVLMYISCVGTIKGDPSQPDNIEISQIAVKTASSGFVQLGDSPQQISNILGTPVSTSTEYWEIHEQNALIYSYNGGKFAFLNDHLDSYELSGSSFLVGSSSIGNFFNVGSTLSSVSSYLPNWSSKKTEGTLLANIINGGVQTDKYIYIKYDSNENITSISIQSY